MNNVLTIYMLAKIFNSEVPAKQTFSYIESCFTTVADTRNFLELDYGFVAKILASSELHITSELEVFNSANSWLSHNLNERKKHAKDVLLKTHLNLLSDHELSFISKKLSLTTDLKICVTMLKDFFRNKEKELGAKSTLLSKSRYCSHYNFSFLNCGCFDTLLKTLGHVNQIDCTTFKITKTLSSVNRNYYFQKAFCIKDQVYSFVTIKDKPNNLMIVKRYSLKTNTWDKVADMYNKQKGFSSCAFMNKLFILGGHHTNQVATSLCLHFDTKNYSWNERAGMIETRKFASCAVFNGKVVISGGIDINSNQLTSVESFDDTADKWTPMPNMIEAKSSHGSVVVKNKLFVLGRRDENCEVFDNTCKMFVAVKGPDSKLLFVNEVIPIGNKFFIFREHTKTVICYDVDEDKWSRKTLKDNKRVSACAKIPWF